MAEPVSHSDHGDLPSHRTHPAGNGPESSRGHGHRADSDDKRHESGSREPKRGDDKKSKSHAWFRRPAVVGVGILLLIIVIVGGVLLWRHSQTHEFTDDAYIDVVAQRVSAQIAGRVRRILVNDNQDVVAGEVLVELDPADFQNRLDQARASQLQAEAQLSQAEAERAVLAVQREQAMSREKTATANAANAARDLQRYQDLHAANAGAVAQQLLDRETTASANNDDQLREARLGIAAVDAQLAHADKQIEAARAAVKSAAAQSAQGELTLSYARITARVDGRIARKTVAPGNFVEPGVDLMAVVPRTVYITANFKETQLARMRHGQAVKIEVDSYPDLELTGRVDSVQPATGQVFDQLPSQNAAGNWVKVVQRVPVKITIDQIPDDPARRLAPGMSVKVTASVH